MSSYLCPVCKAPRSLPLKNNIGWASHFKIFVTTLAIAAIVFLFLGWAAAIKSSIVYLILWAFVEFSHWVKMRGLAKCTVCHFDPILYKQDWKKAREEIEKCLQTRLTEIQIERKKLYSSTHETITRPPQDQEPKGVSPLSLDRQAVPQKFPENP